MKQFVEFLPIALFVCVYLYTKDIYISTAVLMGGMCIQVGYEYGKFRAVNKQTQVIFWVVIIFGGATLLFRNQVFIQWKPTIVNWLFCIALLVSKFLAKDNLLKKLLGAQLSLPDHVWNTLALGWSLGFFIAGALNLVVAYGFSLDFWVSYKLVGGFAITLLYITITMAYLVKGGYIKEETIDQNQ
ncbi:MAG TPA: septation protein [Gammaproteobacteria bacterium]|nr:septation protein [Gammaproteobacteria bacterium]